MYCGNSIANGFGGILAAGVLSGLDGAHGLAGWRYVLLVQSYDSLSFEPSLTEVVGYTSSKEPVLW